MALTPQQHLEQLFSQMNLDEKMAQLGSYWMHELQDGNGFSREKAVRLLPNGIGQLSRTAGDSTLGPVAVADFINSMQSFLLKETRLAIPAMVHEECCSGYMGLGGTAFPQMLGLASAFEPALAERMSTEIRKQLRSVGAHEGLAPTR